jgi:Fur family ferric uptake transcriptional regulator
MGGATRPSVAAIRSRGRRLTTQRSVIWDVLVARGGRHVSAAEVAAAVRERAPGLHRSTVYRTLALLVEDGLVLRADLGGDRSYYELAADHPHHHVVCSRCGGIAHVQDDAIAATAACVRAASGYVLVEQELTFAGLCPACAALHERDAAETGRIGHALGAARMRPARRLLPSGPPPGPGPRPAALGIDAT